MSHAALVRAIIARQLRLSHADELELTDTTRFAALGADGLDMLEIVMDLEVALAIVLDDAECRVDSVGELIAAIERAVADKARAAA